MSKANVVLQLRGIKKRFPGVQALKGVDFDLYENEIHALVGENGAGKTTLMNVLTGVTRKDAGEILFKGKKIEIRHPSQARALGIAYVTQELSLCENLSVMENVVLGMEPVSKRLVKTIAWGEVKRKAQDVLAKVGLKIDLQRRVRELSLPDRYKVELAKALFIKPKVLILDEPTVAFSAADVQHLFNLLRLLRREGCSTVFITHHIEEVFELADRVSVLRDGCLVGTRKVDSSLTSGELIKMMTGKESFYTRSKGNKRDKEILRVEGLTTKVISDINMNLFEGEILGVAGLAGAGRTELLEALFGARRIVKGKIYINGKIVKPQSPSIMIKQKVCYVPEDRRKKGLFLSLSVSRNIGVLSMDQHVRYGLLLERDERRTIKQYIDQLRIVPPSLDRAVALLSGGNQQKVLLARALKSGAKILLLNDPTRGIDVGAKFELYDFMHNLTQRGISIILVSSDLDELLGLSDRIAVMYQGRMVAILERTEATKEIVLRYMFGNTEK